MSHTLISVVPHHDTQVGPDFQLKRSGNGGGLRCAVVLIIQQGTNITKVGWHRYIPVDMALRENTRSAAIFHVEYVQCSLRCDGLIFTGVNSVHNSILGASENFIFQRQPQGIRINS